MLQSFTNVGMARIECLLHGKSISAYVGAIFESIWPMAKPLFLNPTAAAALSFLRRP